MRDSPNHESGSVSDTATSAGRSSGVAALVDSLNDVTFATNLLTPTEVLDAVAPKLTREEEIYALSLKDLAEQTLGKDAGVVINGDVVGKPVAAARFLLSFAATGKVPLPILNSPTVSNLSRNVLNLLESADRRTPSAETTKDMNIVLADAEAKGVDTVMDGVGELNEEEMSVLQSTTSTVLRQLSARLLRRLEVLA
jgi:hypothetical protein